MTLGHDLMQQMTFLDLESPSKLTIDDYYNSPAQNPGGARGSLRSHGLVRLERQGEYNPINAMSDVMADDVWPGGSSATDNEAWHLQANYSVTPIKVMTNDYGASCYTGIHRCNNVMQYMPGVIGYRRRHQKPLSRVKPKCSVRGTTLSYGNSGDAVPYYTANLTSPVLTPTVQSTRLMRSMRASSPTSRTPSKNGGLPMKQTDASKDGHVLHSPQPT
jgi:hypothetical protein